MCGGHHGAAADDDPGAEVIVTGILDVLECAYGDQVAHILALIRKQAPRDEHLKFLISVPAEGAAAAVHGQKMYCQTNAKDLPDPHSISIARVEV